MSEVRALVWGDLHLDVERPYALFREGTTKDKDKRAVPLHVGLAALLMAKRPGNVADTLPVFGDAFPTYKQLLADLERAGIPHRDALGRSAHFHALRKTWQTLGVRYGINQRAAQEVLGHSDANLTAKVYTDVPALALHDEVAKLPWLGGGAQLRAPNGPKTGIPQRFRELLGELLNLAKDAVPEATSDKKAASEEAAKLGAGAGFEPATFRL